MGTDRREAYGDRISTHSAQWTGLTAQKERGCKEMKGNRKLQLTILNSSWIRSGRWTSDEEWKTADRQQDIGSHHCTNITAALHNVFCSIKKVLCSGRADRADSVRRLVVFLPGHRIRAYHLLKIVAALVLLRV